MTTEAVEDGSLDQRLYVSRREHPDGSTSHNIRYWNNDLVRMVRGEAKGSETYLTEYELAGWRSIVGDRFSQVHRTVQSELGEAFELRADSRDKSHPLDCADWRTAMLQAQNHLADLGLIDYSAHVGTVEALHVPADDAQIIRKLEAASKQDIQRDPTRIPSSAIWTNCLRSTLG
jgi:hypothetical protein